MVMSEVPIHSITFIPTVQTPHAQGKCGRKAAPQNPRWEKKNTLGAPQPAASLSFGAVLSLQLGTAHPGAAHSISGWQCKVGDTWLPVTTSYWVLWTDKLLHMWKHNCCHSYESSHRSPSWRVHSAKPKTVFGIWRWLCLCNMVVCVRLASSVALPPPQTAQQLLHGALHHIKDKIEAGGRSLPGSAPLSLLDSGICATPEASLSHLQNHSDPRLLLTKSRHGMEYI